MGRKILDPGTLGGRFHYVPDCFRRDSIAPNLAETTYAPEDQAGVDASRDGPLINRSFRPRRDGNGADMLGLPHQVDNHPMLLADLEILHFETHQFRTSQSAPDEEREDRPVTRPTQIIRLGLARAFL